MDKRFKGLIAISDVLDDRYNKLSDKYHELELSHNRKKRALCSVLGICNDLLAIDFKGKNEMSFISGLRSIAELCHVALFCDGREKTCLKPKNIIKGSKKNANSSKPEK